MGEISGKRATLTVTIVKSPWDANPLAVLDDAPFVTDSTEILKSSRTLSWCERSYTNGKTLNTKLIHYSKY